MPKLKPEYIKSRLKVIDEFLEIALQERKKAFTMQRVRQARQSIAGLTEEINHNPKKRNKS